MKKAGFITLFILALQSITFAQPKLSVKAGVTQFWFNAFDNYHGGSIVGDHQGFELKGKTAVKNLSFSIGYDQHAFGKRNNLSLLDSIGTSTLNYTIVESHRSFPILLYYKLNRFELYAGYEYRFVKGDLSSWNSNQGEMFSFFNFRNEHSLSTGIEYSINNKFSLYGKLYLGDAFILNKNKSTYGTSLDFSLKYYLNKHAKSLND